MNGVAAAGRMAGLVSVTLLALAAPARAAPPLELVWDAPPGCPSAGDVRAEFARLAHLAPGRTPPSLSADGRIEARGGRWHLRLRTVRDGLEGERELEAGTCASLAHAATLVLVLALGDGVEETERATPAVVAPEEPRARPAPRPRPAEIAPAPPPVPAPAPAAPPPPAPTLTIVTSPAVTPVAPSLVWAVAVEGRAGRGPLSGRGLGYGLGADVGRGRWLAMLRLDAWPTVDEATDASNVRASFTGAGGALSACFVGGRVARLTLAACGGAGVAALRGASSGGLEATSAVAPWYTVVPALRARLRLFRAVHADLRFELPVSVTRPRFAFRYLGDVHAPLDVYVVPLLAPAAALGLSVDL
jgi:hypothetical protein